MQKRNLTILLSCFLCLGLSAQTIPPVHEPFVRKVESLGGFPPLPGNSVWTTRNGESFMDRLLQDIGQASSTIEFEYYWFATDKAGHLLRDALIRKAQEGVRIRFIMDNLITPLAPETFYQAIRDAGGDVRYVHDLAKMCPGQAVGSIFGYRDHRKIVVIDNRIAYTGGMNFYDDALYVWGDTQIRVEGPAATQMRTLFEEAWGLAGGETEAAPYPEAAGTAIVQSLGTQNRDERMISLYLEALGHARRYFYLQTPYFAPPPPVVQALKDCAARGVDVRILFPEKCDWGFMNALTRDFLPEMKAAGIRLFLYAGKYDHSKVFVSDDYISSAGTVNMDYRSLGTNWENVLVFYDADVAKRIKQDFLIEAAISQEVGADVQPSKGLRKGIIKFLRKLSPLF